MNNQSLGSVLTKIKGWIFFCVALSMLTSTWGQQTANNAVSNKEKEKPVPGSVAGTARELHVAKKGHDTGAGSVNDPFLTINRAAQKAEPGDKIIIHAGTYREQIVLPRGGTEENKRIIFTASPGETVIVKGSEPVKSWKPLGSGVWRADVPDSLFGRFNPFTTAINVQLNLHLGELYVDGISYMEQLTQEAIKQSPGCWFASKKENFTSIYANFGKINPAKNLVEINVRPAAFIPLKQGVNYVIIDGIKIEQIASGRASIDTEQPGAISTGGGTHWIIQNCEIVNVKCVAISLAQPRGHDTSRHNFNRPAFGEFEDTAVVGHHVIRNNYIHLCGQAGIFSLLHGTLSEIYGNQIEDINGINGFSFDDVSGVHLAVAVDAIIRGNLIRRVHNGSGIMLGPLYQGTRITSNVIMDIKGSPLYFYRSHGLALIDNNVIAGPGSSTGEGVKLRGAEANVFVQNLFTDCVFTNEPLPFRESFGTINYKPHSLIIKQTIPANTVDNKWYNNIFIRGGIDSMSLYHCEADYNVYMGNAVKSIWGDTHSMVVPSDSGFKLTSANSTVNISFNLSAIPKVQAPVIDADFIGRFALSQSIERPDGKPLKLIYDFFGNITNNLYGVVGPFARYQNNNKTARLFERRVSKEVSK